VIGLHQAQLGLRVLPAEIHGVLGRHDIVVLAVKDERGLRELRIGCIVKPIFDQLVAELRFAPFAVMEHLENAGALP
jgi:hypothetical protein